MRRRVGEGFTLLEMLVAATIFLAVMVASFVLFDSGRRMVERSEGRAEVMQVARVALREIERDVMGVFLSKTNLETKLIGTDAGTEGLPADQIEGVAVNQFTLREEGPASDLSRVTYKIEEGRGLIRQRKKVVAPVSGSIEPEPESEEIAKEIVGLNFRYYDGAWKETWDTTTTKTLPQAVEVTVYVKDDVGDPERFTTRFTLPLWQQVPPDEEQTQNP